MYAQMIREELARIGRVGVDPRHVEAFMRLAWGTLDGFGSLAGFRRAVREALTAMDAEPEISEQLARSYGL